MIAVQGWKTRTIIREDDSNGKNKDRRHGLHHLFFLVSIAGLVAFIGWSPQRTGTSSSFVLRVTPKEPPSLDARDSAGEGVARAAEEFVMWNNEETYFNECREHFLHNETWGRPLRPFVDKVQVKDIVPAWSPSVSIIPTLAIYDPTNVTEFDFEAMQSLTQPYMIKPAHRSVW